MVHETQDLLKEEKEERKYRGVYEHPKGSKIYWILFYDADGKRHREKCGRKSIAIARYQQRKTEIREGRFFPRSTVTVEDLKELLFDNYRMNNQNLEPVENSWKRLKSKFAEMRAESVTTKDIENYIRDRQAESYANASINRDLAMLRRMYSLATRSTPRKVRSIPAFPQRLKEAPPRSGFVVDAQYRALMDLDMENWLRAFLAIGYKFGMRKQEILDLRVGQVDFAERIIRLNPGETKNDEGRIAPITSQIHDLLKECVRDKGPGDFLFTRDGKPVKDFRGTWEQLTAAAGVPGLLVHDLRRSAVRNMVRRGIPEKTAMAISGHKTREVFDRYNIINEADIMEAGRKLEDTMRPNRTATTAATKVPRGTRRGLHKSLRIK
jgi:integrase